MIKPIGQYIPNSFYGKKVVVTNSDYFPYKKGDVYFINNEGWVFKQVGCEWLESDYTGYGAELTVIYDEQ
jgi:hypothetical protein